MGKQHISKQEQEAVRRHYAWMDSLPTQLPPEGSPRAEANFPMTPREERAAKGAHERMIERTQQNKAGR